MARPKKERHESKTERLNLRLAPAELVQVEEHARRAGLSLTAYGRLAVLSPRAHALRPPRAHVVDPGLITAVNRIGVNLNQIARSLHSGVGFVPAELDDTLRRVNLLLDEVQQ